MFWISMWAAPTVFAWPQWSSSQSNNLLAHNSVFAFGETFWALGLKTSWFDSFTAGEIAKVSNFDIFQQTNRIVERKKLKTTNGDFAFRMN